MIPAKRGKKGDRELKVLKGLIELYLEEGKPVGSNTLKERLFPTISSATIRNYFASLEEEGLLAQHHTSGGRVPTQKAFRLYAEMVAGAGCSKEDERALAALDRESKEVAVYLEGAAELLSQMTGYAVFMTTPRFDHDFVLEIKLMPLDVSRVLCVLVTDFGSILTETIQVPHKVSVATAGRLEDYFTWRLGGEEPQGLSEEERKLGQGLYNELMVRYITRYSSFTAQEVIRCGFSQLLNHPEFHHATALANGLALFESEGRMRAVLGEVVKRRERGVWIGEEMKAFVPGASHCAVVALPYSIQGVVVGAIGVLGPMRMDYKRLFGLLAQFNERMGQSLAKSLYRFKIHYRQPEAKGLYLEEKERLLIEQRTRD
ncbi:MAG: heat-inducible transcriptional repressor HrcA [Parachlamydiales bacterium]